MEGPDKSSKVNEREIVTYERDDIYVIPSDNSLCSAEEELHDALEEQMPVIVIKDPELSKKTVLWMCIGSCVHHVTLATALGTYICCGGIHESLYEFRKPLAIASVLSNIGHYAIWKQCHLSNYRIAQGAEILCPMKRREQPLNTILVRKVEQCNGIIYTVASLAAATIAFWKDITAFDFKEFFDKITNSADKTEKEIVADEN